MTAPKESQIPFPQRIVYGLRHRRLFNFMDIAGKVIDTLVRLQGQGNVPEDAFAIVGWDAGHSAFRLKDDENTLFVECDIEGIVLTCDMTAEPVLQPIQVKSMFCEVVEAVMSITRAETVNRLGIVHEHQIKTLGAAPAESLVASLTNFKDIGIKGDADSLHLRVAFKNRTLQGMVRPDTSDYRNTIYTLGSVKAIKGSEEKPDAFSGVILTIDHQVYFEPDNRYDSELVDTHYDDLQYLFATNPMAKLFEWVSPVAKAVS
jgi:hypothetical protein